jgi:hypothetical protein
MTELCAVNALGEGLQLANEAYVGTDNLAADADEGNGVRGVKATGGDKIGAHDGGTSANKSYISLPYMG